VEITGDPNAPDDSDDEGGAASSSGPIPTPALVAGGAVVALALWMVWRRRQRAQAFAGI
jgi:LPXTG-motif cell wall-anchored protein